MKSPAVFLDRDGTIIEDVHYIRDPDRVTLVPFAAEGLRLMGEKGYRLFVVSNQSGISRHLISDDEFWNVHGRVCELLLAEKIVIDEFAYCFHHPDESCNCRKPKPGLIMPLVAKYSLDLSKSLTVGDKDSDLLLASSFGGRGYLVRTGKGAETEARLKDLNALHPYTVCQHLLEVAEQLPSIAK